MRDLNHITDGSFSRELVKLTPEAFASLMESYLNEQQKRAIHSEFVKLGLKNDSSLNGILTNILKGLLTKFLDKTGEKIAESAVDYLLPLLNANLPEIGKKFRGFFSS